MANTITMKTEGAGDSATTHPTNGDLTKGELAINTQGGLLFHGDSSSEADRFKMTTFTGTADSLFTVSGNLKMLKSILFTRQYTHADSIMLIAILPYFSTF